MCVRELGVCARARACVRACVRARVPICVWCVSVCMRMFMNFPNRLL